MAPKLRAKSGSKKTGKPLKSKADMEPKILKKRRVMRRRPSLNKLVELKRLFHGLGGFECSGLDFSWLNMKRGRSNARIRRTDFPLSFAAHVRVQSESNIGDVPTDSPVQSPLKVYERRKKSGKVYERRKKRGGPNLWLHGLDQSECDANNDGLSSSTFAAFAAKSKLEDANTLVVLEQMADQCSPFTALAAIETQRKIVDEPMALAAIETQEKTVDGPIALAAIGTQEKTVDGPVALAAIETQWKIVYEPLALAAIEAQEKTVDGPVALAAIETQRKIVDEPMALAAIETQEKTVDGPIALAATETQQKIVDEPIALAATETQQKIVDELMVGKIVEHDNSSSRVEQDVDLGEKANVMTAKVDAWEPLTPPIKEKHKNLEKDNGSSEIGHSSSPNNRDLLVLKNTASESYIDVLKKRSMHAIDTGKKSRRRQKMKRHNPKVVDPNEPFQCSTPMPRTPKPVRKVKTKKNVGQLSNGDGEATTMSRKKSCKQKLYFANECSTMDQEELKLHDTTHRKLEEEFKVPRMLKKRRFKRQRVSLARLNKLIRLVRDKLSSESAFTVLAEKERLETQVQGESFVRKSVEHCENCADEDDASQDNVFLIQDEAFGEAVHDFLVKKMEHLAVKDDESDQLIVMQDPKDTGEIVPSKKKKTKGRRKTSIKDDESGQLIVVQDPKDSGKIVPSKKRKSKDRKNKNPVEAKVDLDEDTLKSFELLMDGKWSEATEAEAVGDWDYMKSQRKLFSEKMQRFLCRMRVVHGSREFTPWKGSILDSVVGVFLTQNTSDNLSSSAFMNLRAKYPPLSLSEQNSLYCRDDQEVMVAGPSLVPTEEPKPTTHVEHPIKNGSESHPEEAETRDAATGIKNGSGSHSEEAEIRDAATGIKNGSRSHSEEAETRDAATHGKKGNGKKKPKTEKKDWVLWGKQYSHGIRIERTEQNADSMNYEAIRQAPPEDIAAAIIQRGMSNQLAGRLKGFLDRLMRDHGSLDLEWLKHVPPTEAKDYFMSFNGLALKSTECVRLLALHFPAFPVDVNAGRFFVRVGYVPLKPMPDSVKLHLLNQYPVLNSIQQYVWPRLCDNSHGTLYEYHCHSVTVAKSFCTKKNPNCVECPMNSECMHYASLRASAQYNLEGSQPKSSDDSTGQEAPMLTNCDGHESMKPITVVEMPPSPVPDEPPLIDIEDFGEMLPSLVPDEPPVVEIEAFGEMPPSPVPDEPSAVDTEDFGQNYEIIFSKNNIHSSMPENDESSKCLVAIHPWVRLPTKKLKFGLSTGHLVFELPDSHPLLAKFDKRDPADPYPYCFAIYLDDPNMIKDTTGNEGSSCSSGEGVPYQRPYEIRGTIMIPNRTANRGAFPLNGTYFQPKELFADHESSQHPIVIPKEWLRGLKMRMLYCGKSITSICKGIKCCEVKFIFNASYICVRQFDRESRSARPLGSSFHYSKSSKTTETSQVQKQMLRKPSKKM